MLSMAGSDCTTIPFNRPINVEYCEPAVVRDNVCSGYCKSVTYPRQDELILDCSVCKPQKYKRVSVVLTCTRGKKKLVKTLKVIDKCACIKISC